MQRLRRLVSARARRGASDELAVEPAPVLELTLADLHRPERVEAATRGTGVDLTQLFGEIGLVAEYVERLRREVAALRPTEAATRTLPAARAELASVAAESETATGAILSAAEAILDAAADGAGNGAVAAYVTEILQACSAGDVASQRLARAIALLKGLEERLSLFGAATGVRDAPEPFDRDAIQAEIRREVLLLAGPGAGGADQAGIDRAFAGATSRARPSGGQA